jgi:hypothetical protein
LYFFIVSLTKSQIIEEDNMKKEIQKKKTMHKKLNIAINSMIGAVSIMGSAALGIGLTQCSKPNPPPTPPTPVVLNILSPENNPKD